MAIQKRWTKHTEQNAKSIDKTFEGVYELGNSKTGKVLYIGEGKIRERILAHLKTNHKDVDVYRFLDLPNKKYATDAEKCMHETHKIEFGELPKYNKHLGWI